MSEEKYEQLLEKVIIFTEEQRNISKSLLEVSQGLKDSSNNLNDKFVLHTQDTLNISKDIKLIKDDLIKWLKLLIIMLFITIGGLSIIKIVGIDFLKTLI
jgi:hypothetical protein